MKLILTCEHGGNDIPKVYKKHFTNNKILKTHRAYDLGALDLFQHLKPLSHASYFSTTSRLLVELNRSLHHPQLFSEFTKKLPDNKKAEIIEAYYKPYRTLVENSIKKEIANGISVLHISVHSFTPQLNGDIRNCAIGLLFDYSKDEEKQICKKIKAQLLKENSNLKIRFNYPYLGKADGFTTYLRKQFPKHYLGIEIEVNQKFASKNSMKTEIKASIYRALNSIL
ncbi:N-formylglutamate amidohydrolase [Lacinutrix chionoecetis]